LTPTNGGGKSQDAAELLAADAEAEEDNGEE